jgi:hypothetical protein
MRAFKVSLAAVVLAGLSAGTGTTASAQSSASNPAVTTVGQAIDQIVARERDELAVIRRYSPIVETYVQDMKPDQEMGIIPVKDHYYLGQAQLAGEKGVSDTSLLDNKKKTKGEEFNPFAHLESGSKYVPEGFVQMVFVDPNGFDKEHYVFNYVGREFIGEVRCLVFDVTPLPKTGKGRFNGRIWAEDQGFAIVRYNGVFTSSDGESKGFNLHFDSWRMNLQPDLWLPALIYSQESELKTDGSDSPVRFRAQTRLWGYDLQTSNSKPVDLNQVPLDQGGIDKKSAQDYSPIEAEQKWQATAENNVLERLQRIGLVAPPGEVDKVLETVINNLEVTNNLDVDVRCRVMLTGTLESFSIGHTIVVSRGLIDVLPDEASLATVLAQELAQVIMTKPSTDQWGFNDTTNVTAGEALSHFSFKGTSADIDRSNTKALDLLKHSPYKDKLGSAALFMKQLSAESQALPSLIDARLGNGVALSQALMQMGPQLDANKLDQVAALPLGGRVKLNPWDDRVELLKAKPVSLNSAREKMPFEVTPFLLFLTRYQAPKAGGKPDATSNASSR